MSKPKLTDLQKKILFYCKDRYRADIRPNMEAVNKIAARFEKEGAKHGIHPCLLFGHNGLDVLKEGMWVRLRSNIATGDWVMDAGTRAKILKVRKERTGLLFYFIQSVKGQKTSVAGSSVDPIHGRLCKHCGCSEFDPCFDQVLQDGCAWVSPDECSSCKPDKLKAKFKKAGLA